MLSALAEDGRANVSEFESYPSRPDEFRWLLAQPFDVIVIDLDSDSGVALALVEKIKADGTAKVMVYSNRADTKLAVRFMRAGAREYLALPLEPGIVKEALDRVAIAIREQVHPAKQTAGNLFVCLCAKGGSGVTTVACNLAVALARESEQSTLLIDLALPIGDAALALGITPKYSTEDALRNIERLDGRLLRELLVRHRSGAYVLAAPSHVLGLDGCGESIEKIIALARREFDHVIVDLGSRMDLSRTTLFKKATTIYLVTLTGVSELRNSNYLISQFFPTGGPRLELVVNRFETRLLGGVNEEVVNKALGRPVRWKIPDDREAAREMQFGEIGIAETRIAQLSLEMASTITGRPIAQEKKKSFSLRGLGKNIAEEVSSNEEPLSIKIVPPAILRATPTITWPTPEPIRYGDALSAAHLNASAPVAGRFQYSPDAGSVLPAGTHTLSVTFTPADGEKYGPARAAVPLTVDRATPEIAWPAPDPIAYGTPLGDSQLGASASVPGTFDYSPAPGAVLPAGTHTLSAEFTASESENYAPVQASVSLKVTKAMPAFEWPVPKPIRFGTPLSAEQLCATASVPGRFDYSPAAGELLAVGTHALSVSFSPADSANYSAAQAILSLHVEKAAPTIEWPAPAPVIFGTPLSLTQLRATAPVPGTFNYAPAAGAVLAAGSHRLWVTFTPTDSTDYAVARATVSFDVSKATPTLDWPAPQTIKFGTRLSQRQCCATASVPGTFEYSPALGEVLAPGAHTLSVIFKPTDSADYEIVEASVPLTVEAKATPAVAWSNPEPITYGTRISGKQLCARASVSGRFDYSVEPDVELAAGTHTLSVTFTPTDSENYAQTQATVSLEVAKATPTIHWTAPEPIMDGTRLSTTQLCATASTRGTLDYSAAAGTQLSPGTHALTVTFTPADRANYTTAQATVPLTVVAREIPEIAWPAPDPIPYGTVLSRAQLCATASVPGTFDYSPAAGEILTAGTRTLSVRFTPTDTENYATTESSVSLIVEREPAVIAWPIPDPITYGTRLSARQLCATASVPGRFDYSPALGVLLAAGTHTLAVTFTPADSENYAAAQATVALEIAKATPAVEWAAPQPIQFETALSATQLCATASVPGTLEYSPERGAVLAVGLHTLSVIFTPADSANYVAAQTSVPLKVMVKPSPAIAWRKPDPISYGTLLSSIQLCATASVPGTFDYSPEVGETLAAGTHTLSVTFTPTDTAGYATTQATVSLLVEKATPSIDWRTPEPIKPGTPLSDVQLDALTWIPGTFVYSPAAGEVLPPGTHKLSVTFTPSSDANYVPAQATVTIKVIAKTTPVIVWPNPDPIPSGTRLSRTQLRATASVPGIFDYSPEVGEVLPVGRHTLSVSFIPDDTEKYRATQATVVLDVERLPAIAPLPLKPFSSQTPKPVVKSALEELPAAPLLPPEPVSSETPKPVVKLPVVLQMPETDDAMNEGAETSIWPYTVHPARALPIELDIAPAVEQMEEKGSKKWLIAAAAGIFSMVLLLVFAVLFFHRGPKVVAEPSIQPLPVATNVPVQSNTPKVALATQSGHAEPPPATPPEAPKPTSAQAEMMSDQLNAPTRIPKEAPKQNPANAAPPPSIATAGLGGSGAMGTEFHGQAPHIVMAAPIGRLVISARVAMGLLIHKTLPVYPSIAKEARVAGTVVMEVDISKDGAIQSTHVVSGPMMLREAAQDAVRTWRFKPYILNNQPIETRTTIDVTFTLAE